MLLTCVVDKNCDMVNKSESVLGPNKLKPVKQCQKHVKSKVKT